MSKSRESKHLSPADAKIGRELSFDGVAIEIVEVNELKHPFGDSTFTVCYRIKDVRQSPIFVSEKAHLFVSRNSNLQEEFRKVRDHYENIKSMLRG